MRTQTVFLLSILTGLAVACMPTVPPSPQVQVEVTVVDENMLDDAVAAALTGTASSGVALTETALAAEGVTLTPTPTATTTFTPVPPSATPYVSPTASLTPPPSRTPTITAVPSNTPVAEAVPEDGQLRVVHAWRSEDSFAVDVFFDELPVALGLATGQSTAYFGVGGDRTVRVMLLPPAYRTFDATNDQQITLRQAAVAEQLVEVPQGSSVTVALVNVGNGPQIQVIHEDISPLATGLSRVTLIHAHANLLRVDALEPVRNMVLARNLGAGDQVGPFDLSAGPLSVQLNDTEIPDTLVVSARQVELISNTNYLIFFIPSVDFRLEEFATEMLIIGGNTRLTQTDTPVRFINAAPNVGPISIIYQHTRMAFNLGVGEATTTLPISRQKGGLLILDEDDKEALQIELGPWTEAEADTDKIVLISDVPQSQIDPEDEQSARVEIHVFTRGKPTSPALANIRLIHGLTGATQTLDFEIRATDRQQIDNPIGIPQTVGSEQGWSRVARNVGFGEASDYVTRASNIFDMRVLLSTSGGVQATLERQALLPGGAYDLVVVPGPGVGVTRLLMLEPNPQVTILGSRRGDPEVVEAIVNATLTAAAPNETSTLAVPRTPTPTISPVPTNTPRPTNTPVIKAPSIEVNPAPPDTVQDTFILFGENFAPNARYTINLDNGPTILSGQVDERGELAVTVDLQPNVAAGPHTVRACVDCRDGGAQQEALAVFVVANPQVVPSVTPQP